MSNVPKFRDDGELDGRGHADGSKATRFTPGDGRRRPGRPRGAKSFKTLLREVADMPVVNTGADGTRRRMSTKEALLLKLREQAFKGNFRAIEYLIDHFLQSEPMDDELGRTAVLLEEDKAILASARAREVLGPVQDLSS